MKKLIQVSDHVYFMKYRRLGDRPNLYYIKGKDYSICVDAGNSKSHIERFYNVLKEHHLPEPKYTIITHWHWDHTFALKYVKGESISCHKTYEKLKEVKKWKWDNDSRKERLKTGEEIKFCDHNISVEYTDAEDIQVELPNSYLDENKTLDLGDIKVELIVRDSTHTRDNIFVYIPTDEVLIVADADCPDYYHGEVYEEDKLKDMINFFESLNYKYHCLGHALPESKEYALERLKQI